MYIIVIMLIGFISPIVGIALSILLFAQKRSPKSAAIIFGISMALMLYCYIPDSENDIFRHFIAMDVYKNIPVWQCFGRSRFQSGVFTWDLWLWIMAQFNNMQLLQASGAFIGYTILAWIVFDYACVSHLKNKQWITILLVSLTIVPILDIAIGIRNANAFIIVASAFYRYYVKNTGIVQTVCALLVALFLHHAVIPIIAAWVVLPLFSKHKGICALATVVFLSAFTSYAQTISVAETNNIVGILYNSIIGTTQIYTSYAVTSFHSLFTRYLQMLFAAVLLARTYVVFSKKHIDSIDKLWNLSFIIFVVGVSMSFDLGSNGNRFFIMSMLVSLIPFAQSIVEKPFPNRKKCICLDAVIIFCAAGSFALYLHNMDWGSGSVMSFLLGGIAGPIAELL